jgi:hypothetical protein
MEENKYMKIDFDITKAELTPHCDNYDFTLGVTKDDEGDECYLVIDIPCKGYPEWRFWLLFEDDTAVWDISDEDKMYIQNKIMEYCLAYGYLYNGSYFYFE